MKTPSVTQTLKNLNWIYSQIGKWQDVADFIGVNRATINKWFSGRRTPSPETRLYIAQLAKALG